MFRKILIFLLMGPLVAAAWTARISMPILILMGALLLVALASSAGDEEIQE